MFLNAIIIPALEREQEVKRTPALHIIISSLTAARVKLCREKHVNPNIANPI
jgi:hypothetical protein